MKEERKNKRYTPEVLMAWEIDWAGDCDQVVAYCVKIKAQVTGVPARRKIKENTPWYPPEEKFGPWVETYGNTITDVPDGYRLQLLTRWQRTHQCGPMHIMLMQTVREDHEKGLRFFSDFVAYRIVL